MTYFEETL